ncbi:RNA-directed DNA polymerase [Comamonadaceae bacterium M7527]|nr:RNA-directed DNA polymerase [Comamonadaceae bacterium M7527]
MPKIIELSNADARVHFLKGSSYFNGNFPPYISFEPLLLSVASVLNGGDYQSFKCAKPHELPNVNYSFTANKDGRLAWRPLELIHPALYVSLVNALTTEANWATVQQRMESFKGGVVECCGAPLCSSYHQTDVTAQILGWWQAVEQRSLAYSLEYTHLLHTDVTDCYGALYTHSIPWALHGLTAAKGGKKDPSLLGNVMDSHIQAGRYGQTNGIPQGSVLMDFVAEIVLGYVDSMIGDALGNPTDVRILRYRDDYRIFSNNQERGEEVLKIVSDKLRSVGMRLGVSKTIACNNVIEGSVKPDKLAGIALQDLDSANAKTIQKQLLRLHAFGRHYPNSGALKRLVSEFHSGITKQTDCPDDLDVQVAITTDIAFTSPSTIPAVAGILSHLISLAPSDEKSELWSRVRGKMARVPYNGYLEVWMQRVIKPKAIGIAFESEEPICRIVNRDTPTIWDCTWISSAALKSAIDVTKLVISDPTEVDEVVQPEEVELFKQNAFSY